jgi:hypothetical protein
MKKSEFEDLNKLLAILDASKVDMIVNLSSTWSEEDYDVTKNIKALKINPYLDSDRNLVISKIQKEEILGILADNFDDSDYYHYKILFGTKIIGLGYDSCVINFLHPAYFNLTKEHLEILEDDEIVFQEDIEE